jgi:iron complex transport system ATP-binding protein
LLREEAKRGVAVAVTLHELSLAARVCDRILLLDRGRLAAAGTPDEALSSGVLARVFGVEAVRVTGPDGLSVPVPWRIL